MCLCADGQSNRGGLARRGPCSGLPHASPFLFTKSPVDRSTELYLNIDGKDENRLSLDDEAGATAATTPAVQHAFAGTVLWFFGNAYYVDRSTRNRLSFDGGLVCARC